MVEDVSHHEVYHVVDGGVIDEGHGIGGTHHVPVIGIEGGRAEGSYGSTMVGWVTQKGGRRNNSNYNLNSYCWNRTFVFACSVIHYVRTNLT